MGKRRKAIRWLVAIVIVALIGGVTAVAVDRRIREQVEEEYLDRVMEMVNLNGWYRKALSITGEAKYSWDGIEYPEGMYIDKKSIYTQILEIRLFTTKYKEMEYSDLDQLLQEYEAFCETGQKSEMLDDFNMACEYSSSGAPGINPSDIPFYVRRMGIGALKIENGNVVEIKDLGDGIYDMDIGDDEWLELCKKFEKNSEILLDWMRD